MEIECPSILLEPCLLGGEGIVFCGSCSHPLPQSDSEGGGGGEVEEGWMQWQSSSTGTCISEDSET